MLLQTMMKSFIPEQQELTTLKLNCIQKQENCEVLAKIVEKKDARFRTAMEEYSQRMYRVNYTSRSLICPLLCSERQI